MEILQGCKYIWKIKPIDTALATKLSLETSFSLPVAKILLAKNLTTKDQILDFLFPQIYFSEQDVFLMKDAAVAVKRIAQAIDLKEKILIFGDYDVDGMTSTSIAMLALRHLDANVSFYLPDRVRDGYGLSTKIVELAAKNGYSLIITVDNGTTCLEAAALAKELKIDLIITDHHQPKGELPVALALVNPHQKDCSYSYKYFCGAGVIFKLMSFLYQQKNKELPEKVFELLMMGTVADVVPLTGENRFWVQKGLKLLTEQKQSFSFRCLAGNAGKEEKTLWRSSDIGFGIAPQLNALGRLADPKRAIKFLISSDQQAILDTASVLKEVNSQRKEIEGLVYQEIEKQIKSKQIDLEKERVILAASQSWPAGVIGLVAGRFTANYGRPCFLFHITEDGLAKGSARSIVGSDLFAILTQNSALLKSFGGHKLAAGLSLAVDDLSVLKQNLEQQFAELFSFEDLQPALQLDAEVDLTDLNSHFLQDFEKLEPFGNENSSPILYFKDVRLHQAPILIKDLHVKAFVRSGVTVKTVIFFNRPELYSFLLENQNEVFSLAAQILLNEFKQKTTLELQGLDIYKKA